MARMPAALACGVLGNGLSPISSSTTSLPCAFNARAAARTVKAVSAVRLFARALRRGVGSRAPMQRLNPAPRLRFSRLPEGEAKAVGDQGGQERRGPGPILGGGTRS